MIQGQAAQVVAMVRARGYLETLSDAECHVLLKKATVRSYRPGEGVFVHGAPADEVGWLLSGEVQLLLHGARGGPRVAQRLGPGEAVGFVAFLAKGRHLLTVQAATPCQVMLLGREHFLAARRRRDPLFAKLQVALAIGAFNRVAALEHSLSHGGR